MPPFRRVEEHPVAESARGVRHGAQTKRLDVGQTELRKDLLIVLLQERSCQRLGRSNVVREIAHNTGELERVAVDVGVNIQRAAEFKLAVDRLEMPALLGGRHEGDRLRFLRRRGFLRRRTLPASHAGQQNHHHSEPG